MLEVNVYDNFNPNYLNISDYKLPTGGLVSRPLPAPKARCVAINYELWETGYLYTSTATFSFPVVAGDIVEILFPEKVPIETQQGVKKSFDLTFLYYVSSVDEDNKATLKNYFWASIQGQDIPNAITKTTNFAIINYMIDASKTDLMVYGYLFNSAIFNGKATINRKADTAESTEVAKRIFSKVQYQPTSLIYNGTKNESGTVIDQRRTVLINFASRDWTRKRITTRIDIKQSVTVDTETIVERSTYNFAIIFIKNASTDDYTDPPTMYTVKDNGDVINYAQYNGDGTDLPEIRLTKTLFYDEAPSIATIKSEISPSTVVTRLIFEQNELLPLYVNDLVNVWYEGTLYSGYIADRVKTEFGDRLVFVEGASVNDLV